MVDAWGALEMDACRGYMAARLCMGAAGTWQGLGCGWGGGGVSLHYRTRFDIFLWALGTTQPTSAGVRPRFLLNFVRS